MGIDVLIPTISRPGALAVTLAGLLGQTERHLRIVVSDQSDDQVGSHPLVANVVRVLRLRGHEVEVHHHLPRRGISEQRAFLLDQARRPYALCLDDDVLLEPETVARMLGAIEAERCGFVTSAMIGASFADDVRPHEQAIELWEGPVEAEVVRPGTQQWERYKLHNAANLLHVQRRHAVAPSEYVAYKVAWGAGCVLFDVAKLRAVGGYDFWTELPVVHAGEDVLAQLRVMARFGGCGILPSGAWHQELPTTVSDRRVDAHRVLPLFPAAS